MMNIIQKLSTLMLLAVGFSQTTMAHQDGTAHIHTSVESVLNALADHAPLLILAGVGLLLFQKFRKL
jgi:hypothetical protein